jgi:hypothetical protein
MLKKLYAQEAEPIDYSLNVRIDWDALHDQQKQNFERLKQEDAEARAQGTLLGRYIYFSVGDGRAFYQIVKVNKRSVRVMHCPNVAPDDWTLPMLGFEGTLTFQQALHETQRIEAIDRLFGR